MERFDLIVKNAETGEVLMSFEHLLIDDVKKVLTEEKFDINKELCYNINIEKKK